MTPEQIVETITERFADIIESSDASTGMATFVVRPDGIEEVCQFLKEDPGLCFDYLMSLTAVDWTDRFEVVYHLYSIPEKHFAVLKVPLDREDAVIRSVSSIWKAANWQEREVYDMFGIEFDGHPNLQRILLEPSWEGFPLRKDYSEED